MLDKRDEIKIIIDDEKKEREKKKEKKKNEIKKENNQSFWSTDEEKSGREIFAWCLAINISICNGSMDSPG